jgi:hypothetical protein
MGLKRRVGKPVVTSLGITNRHWSDLRNRIEKALVGHMKPGLALTDAQVLR